MSPAESALFDKDPRAPGIQILELIFSPGTLNIWAALGKCTLLLLGLAALLGWAWSTRLRSISTMIGSSIVGTLFVAGAGLVSYYFG